MITRRAFLATTAFALPLTAVAQPVGKQYRVAFLGDSPAVLPHAVDAFRKALRDLGYNEGRNIVIEYRWAEGNPERMRELADELVRLKVDVIVVPSSIYTAAAKRASTTIPIVFMSHADPVSTGHVVSLSRPGGNATGLSIMATDTNVKLLQLYKQAVPVLTRAAAIYDPATPSHVPGLKALEEATSALKMNIQALPVRSATEYEGAFAAIMRERAAAILILSTPLFTAGSKRLADLAIMHRLPSMSTLKEYAEAGGFMTYSSDRLELYRRGANYVDRILKGANPAELPVEQPTKFELVVNARTAKSIGLTIPQSLLVRAELIP